MNLLLLFLQHLWGNYFRKYLIAQKTAGNTVGALDMPWPGRVGANVYIGTKVLKQTLNDNDEIE